MELDDFKNRKGYNPVVASDDKNVYKDRLDELIHIFKSYQEKERRKSLGWIAINICLAVIYISSMHLNTGFAALGYIMAGAGFVGGALYLYFRYKPLSPHSYSLPVMDFLAKAEKRIRYFTLTDYIIILLLLILLGTGGGFIFTSRLLRYTEKAGLLIIIWIIFFIALTVFGFLAGRKNWEKDYGTLHKNLQELKRSSANGDKI